MKKVYGILAIACISLSECNEVKKISYSPEFIIAVQDTIIGDLTFGIKEDVAAHLIEELNEKNEEPQQEDARFIGKFQYDLITADYDNDSGLYKLRIHGMNNNKKANDTAILEKLYELKYGIADMAPSVYTIRAKGGKHAFYFNNVRTWKIGKKSIIIQEIVNDTNRRVDLLIYEPAIENKIIADKEKEKHNSDSIQNAAELRKKY